MVCDDWKILYFKAIFESDHRTVQLRIDAAEQALRLRSKELEYTTNAREKRQVAEAARMLELLKRTEMGS